MKSELVENVIEQFKQMITVGLENISKACRLYVEAIDKDTAIHDKFRDAFPQISESCWASFELVGRGMMHESLIWGGGRSASKLRLLPISVQRRAIEEGIEVLASDGTTLKVKPEDLTSFQIKQVFANKSIRSLPQQKAFIETLNIIDKKTVRAEGDYMVKGGELKVLRPCHFNKSDLLRILQAMV